MLKNKRETKKRVEIIDFMQKKQYKIIPEDIYRDRARLLEESEIKFQIDIIIGKLLDKGIIEFKDAKISVDADFIKSIQKIDKSYRD